VPTRGDPILTGHSPPASRTHRQHSTSLVELADAAEFLASDRARALTGTVLNLTGGIVAD